MKTILLYSIAILTIVGCAGAGTTLMKEKRGYSEADIAQICEGSTPYINLLSKGRLASNALNTTEKVNAENRLKNIWCACVKKLGPKCRQKSDGLSPSDKTLWLKANSAEQALNGMAALDDPFSSTPFMLDEAECQ